MHTELRRKGKSGGKEKQVIYLKVWIEISMLSIVVWGCQWGFPLILLVNMCWTQCGLTIDSLVRDSSVLRAVNVLQSQAARSEHKCRRVYR